MRGALVLVAAAACAHHAKPEPVASCGMGWAPLTLDRAQATDRAIRGEQAPAPDGVIGGVIVDGVSGELMATLRSVLQTRAGQRVADAPLAEDIRRLWQLGLFSEVWLEARGDVIAFVVAPHPRIAHVVVHANDPAAVKRFELLGGAAFEPMRLSRMARAIEAGFVREGHLDAKVEVVQQPRRGGVDVCVVADRGPKITIASVTFPGRHQVPEAALHAAMKSSDPQTKINHIGGIYDADAMSLDQLYLSAEYWDRGFANVHVGEPKVTRVGAKIAIELPIREGDVFRLGRVTVTGVPAARLSVKPGEVFSRSKIAAAREQLGVALGGIDVLPLTHLDLERRTIDLTFEPKWRWPWDALAHLP